MVPADKNVTDFYVLQIHFQGQQLWVWYCTGFLYNKKYAGCVKPLVSFNHERVTALEIRSDIGNIIVINPPTWASFLHPNVTQLWYFLLKVKTFLYLCYANQIPGSFLGNFLHLWFFWWFSAKCSMDCS